MDSSGRTTERQYDVGGERLNTNSARHLGVWQEVRQPSLSIRGAQDGEGARTVAGELQSRGGGEQESHTQHQVEEFPWLRETPLEQSIQSPSWENSPELLTIQPSPQHG